MRIRATLALVLSACFMMALLPGAPPAEAAAITEKPYYLIDEEFAALRVKDWPILGARPSGWTVKAAGGELSAGYNSWFKISDYTPYLPVEMTKTFRAENDGFYTLEYRFNFSKMMEDTAWRVRSDDKVAVGVIVKNGNLCLETGGSPIELGSAGPLKEMGVRVDFDLPAKKINAVYVNGVLKAENVNFKENVDSINNVQIITGVEATGEMFLNPVKLYKNFVVNEKLISTNEGDFPSDWALDSAGGTAAVAKISSTTPPDFYSLKINDTSTSSAVSMSKTVPPQSGPYTYEYKMLFEKKADGVSAGIFSGGTKVFELITKSGGFAYTAADGSAVTVPGYENYLANLWYTFHINFDTVTKKADLWINGRKAVVGIALPEGTGPVDKLLFATGAESTGVYWLDDIRLGANPPLPEDYVPVPVNNAAKDDYLIGMQNCSLWREGRHGGWDFISGWPQRKPALGFYDEGNTEVADWQTKFLVENGVDFMLTSWFRPNLGKDTKAPIKDPYTAVHALHEGYFYAEYSDMLKYAIYWENGGNPSWAGGSEDFRKNYVPFWIEYYFKDPRYLKVDNKPVIAILTYSGLKNNFGTPEQIKAEMDYLKSECKKAGFDGAYVISMCGSATKEDMDLRKQSGIDALYYYGHNFDNVSASAQINKMVKYQEASDLDIIAHLGANQDYTAWGNDLYRGGNMHPDEFYELCKWAKEEYMPKEKGIAKKVALLGIWNEYGEGSYLMPCPELYGFGYLDSLRKAFLPGVEADNIYPGEASINRMGKLYTEPGRVIPPLPDLRPDVNKTTVKKGWYFDTDGDFEGWSQTRHVDNLTVKDGMLSGVTTDVDPGIKSPDNLGINIDNVPFIRLEQKNSIGNAGGEIYFITEKDQNWDEAKCIRYNAEGGPGEAGTTIIYMETNDNWRGTLKAIRFDPFTNSPGETFAYGAIELLTTGGEGEIRIEIDGERNKYDQPPVIISDRVMVPLRGIFKALGAEVDWDGPTRTVTAFKRTTNTLVELTIGEKTAYINRKPVQLDQPAEIVNSRTLVPVRFVSEAMGALVEWIADERTVRIDTSFIPPIPEPEGKNLTPEGNMEARSHTFGKWDAVLELTNKEAHAGRQSLKVTETSDYGCAKIPVELKAGEEYYFSAWVKLDPATTQNTVMHIAVNYTVDDKALQKIAITSGKLNSEKWTQVTGTYVIAETSPVFDTHISLLLDKPPGKHTFYVDDVKVIKVGGAAVTATPAPAATPRPTPTPAPTPQPTQAPAASGPASDGPSEAIARKENLVKDPGMEGSSMAHLPGDATVEFTKEQIYTGKQALKVTKKQPYGMVHFEVGMKSGVEYEISAWVRTGASSVATKVKCLLSYTVGGEKVEKTIFSGDVNSSGWTQLKGTYKIEERAQISNVTISLFGDNPPSEGDVLYIDDVIVAPL